MSKICFFRLFCTLLALIPFCVLSQKSVEIEVPQPSSFLTTRLSVNPNISEALSSKDSNVEITCLYNSRSTLLIKFSNIEHGYYSFSIPESSVEFRVYSGKVEFFYNEQFIIGLPSHSDSFMLIFSGSSDNVRARVQLISASPEAPVSNDVLWNFSHYDFKATELDDGLRSCKFIISTSSDFSGTFEGFFVPTLK